MATLPQTEQEVDDIIAALIIDNTTGAINPNAARQVLRAINHRVPGPSDPSVVSFSPPLEYDTFSNTVSIPKADEGTDGYMEQTDFYKINFRPFGNMFIFKGPENTGKILEIDDVAMFNYKIEETLYFFVGSYKGGDVNDIPNSWGTIMDSQYK